MGRFLKKITNLFLPKNFFKKLGLIQSKLIKIAKSKEILQKQKVPRDSSGHFLFLLLLPWDLLSHRIKYHQFYVIFRRIDGQAVQFVIEKWKITD